MMRTPQAKLRFAVYQLQRRCYRRASVRRERWVRSVRVAVIGSLTCTLAALVVVGPAGGTPRAPVATCGPTWAIVPSPSVGNDGTFLNAVSALSSLDAWAVGSYNTITQNITITTTPFILRWDGTAWSQVSSNSSPGSKSLSDVVDISASDAWAVGFTWENPSQPYAEHWDGTTWSEVSLPVQSSSAI